MFETTNQFYSLFDSFPIIYIPYATHAAGIWIPTFATKSPSYVGKYTCTMEHMVYIYIAYNDQII